MLSACPVFPRFTTACLFGNNSYQNRVLCKNFHSFVCFYLSILIYMSSSVPYTLEICFFRIQIYPQLGCYNIFSLSICPKLVIIFWNTQKISKSINTSYLFIVLLTFMKFFIHSYYLFEDLQIPIVVLSF